MQALEQPDYSGGPRRLRLRHNNCQAAAITCSRATPPHRQNQLDVALLTSDAESETPNYKGEGGLCQARLDETKPIYLSQPRKLEDPLHEIPNADREAAEQEN